MTDLMFFHDLPAEEQRAMLEDEAIRVGPLLFRAEEEKESVRVPSNDERRAMWSAKYYNRGEHRVEHARNFHEVVLVDAPGVSELSLSGTTEVPRT